MGCASSSPEFSDPNNVTDIQTRLKAVEYENATLKQQLAQKTQQAPIAAGIAAPNVGGQHLEVLWFPIKALPCNNMKKPGGCRRTNCTYSHEDTSLTRLQTWLNWPKRTLDICVFTITCDDISNIVLEAHRRGVLVRVITDNDQMKTQGSDIGKFAAAGIAVRHDNEPTHMHHKFAILDGRVLLNGSFNWTRQAVLGNQENLMIMDTPVLVADFQKHFELLWTKYQYNTSVN